ncbi:hypothetical protein ACTVCO_06535 [Sanguibacter sp. A247]|uniref:hypothetical protein n=1 Tax=unclassified Sanguibacter TaxID=2645534 RepID=UPI003FD88631
MAPASAPPVTATPTPTVDPNPADLAPLPADELDASFVTIENFFKAYEHGLRTGNQSVFTGLFTTPCKPCTALLGNIESVAEPGVRAEGGSISFSRADLLESTVPGRLAWRLELTQRPTTFFDVDGTTTSLDGFTGPTLVEVGSDDGTWVITGIDTAPGHR